MPYHRSTETDRDGLPVYGSYPGAKQPKGRTEELRERYGDRGSYRQTYRYDERYDDDPPEEKPPKKPKRGHPILWTAAFLFSLTALLALLVLLVPQVAGLQFSAVIPTLAFANGTVIQLDADRFDTYWEAREYMVTDTIYPGVTIDGIDVGGMTKEQAIAAVNAVASPGAQSFSVNVIIDGRTWTVDSTMVPLTRDTESVVERAWAVGRAETEDSLSVAATPFAARLSEVSSLAVNGLQLTTTESYDRDTIAAMAQSITAEVNRDPVSAAVASFDTSSKTFTFTEDESGQYVDPDALTAAIENQIAVGGSSVVMTPQILLADVTRAELIQSFGKISSYTTRTTDNNNRNTNVRLSAEAINGVVVNPGETFSFNDTVGERTEAKGYKAASAISGGQSRDEIGGGVCQTSSTLFNAVARANMTIVTRSPHAWPSSYVEKGMDATVNWPSLDFKFRNDTDWPIYIVASYYKQKVTVEVYGHSLGDGVTIDLESVTTQTIPAPTDVKFVQNTDLKPGTNNVTVKARDGYEVDTYQVWYRNGVEYDRVKLCHSTYKTYQKTVEYN